MFLHRFIIVLDIYAKGGGGGGGWGDGPYLDGQISWVGVWLRLYLECESNHIFQF